MASKDVVGQWDPLINLENVAVHASLLTTGKVLYWGRRSNLSDSDLNQPSTKTYIWDPATGKSKPTATQPKLFVGTKDEKGVNLFCSGHCFQADGNLLVVGGHLRDGHGDAQACVYDFKQDSWTAKPLMNSGRWYPSALTLSDSSVISISGSFGPEDNPAKNAFPDVISQNVTPQLWHHESWVNIAAPMALLLYPRLHLDPSGRVFMAGPQKQSQFLKINASGGVTNWSSNGPERSAGEREWAPSVMYAEGKVMYIGGGNEPGGTDPNDRGGPPTNKTEFIDLKESSPTWRSDPKTDMWIPRRQHNATVLPDGTVLVTGGTRGQGFNNLASGNPVHTPELWDPVTQKWTLMAEESADRCYHSVALLLPDGRVFSAGGGEYSPNTIDGKLNATKLINPAKDTLTNAQIFNPPYLFKQPRPSISSAPLEVAYGQKFEVSVGVNDTIRKASWVRLGSVTHANNMNQSLMFLNCEQQKAGAKVIVAAPGNANLAPPGHYMLFLLNELNVPSTAAIVHIGSGTKPHQFQRRAAEDVHVGLPALNEKIINEQDRPHVKVGLTPVCPYGLGSCWGGAYDALNRMADIDIVRPVPDQANSVAFVYLKEGALPDIDAWRREFEDTANGAYHMRGIEMTLSGNLSKQDEQLTLTSVTPPVELILEPYHSESKIEWNLRAREPQPVTKEETSAFERLSTKWADHAGALAVKVTGRLHKHDDSKYSLDVKEFEVV